MVQGHIVDKKSTEMLLQRSPMYIFIKPQPCILGPGGRDSHQRSTIVRFQFWHNIIIFLTEGAVTEGLF